MACLSRPTDLPIYLPRAELTFLTWPAYLGLPTYLSILTLKNDNYLFFVAPLCFAWAMQFPPAVAVSACGAVPACCALPISAYLPTYLS